MISLMTSSVAAVLVCAVLGLLAVFQAGLVAGLPLGRFAWGGQHIVLPSRLRIGSAVSIVLYAVFAGIAWSGRRSRTSSRARASSPSPPGCSWPTSRSASS